MKPFLILLLLAATVFSKEPAKQESPNISALEQGIIEAGLASSPFTAGSEKLVLEDHTTLKPLSWGAGNDYEKLSERLREEAQGHDAAFLEALEDFIAKNRVEAKLLFPNPLPKNVQLVSRVRIQKIFAVGSDKKPNGWDKFYGRFPHTAGFVMIARPGVDAKHTIAILYLGVQSEYLAGLGGFWVLKFDGKKWAPTDEFFSPNWFS